MSKIERKCSEPGCGCTEGPLFLHSLCHPDMPTWASIENDKLTIRCAECGQPIATFTVVDEAQ